MSSLRRAFPSVLFALTLLAASTAEAHGPTVRLGPAGPSPSRLTLEKGQTVHFDNQDTETHQVVGDENAFQSPSLAPGKGWHLRFPFPGEFPYAYGKDPVHRGTIVVEAGD
ncbi:MAG: hypothetical protein AAF430_11145 [Myxococcota bacterium]